MYLIDIHTHVYPQNIAHKAAASIRDFYELNTREMDGTVDTLLQRGAKAGISRFVILPVAVKPEHTRHINDFILEQAGTHQEFIGFGTLHAAMDHIEEEADYILQQGLHGIKMHPDTQEFAIDDPRLFPVYDQIQGKLPVLFHMGDTRFNYSHPARLRRILGEFPRLQVVAAHFGGYRMYETAMEYLRDTSCLMDVSSSMMFMPEGLPEKYINIYGAERLAFGTDYPLWDPVPQTERFLRLKITDDQFEQIGHRTVEQLLNL